MNTKSITVAIVAIIAIGGGIWLYTANDTEPAGTPAAGDANPATSEQNNTPNESDIDANVNANLEGAVDIDPQSAMEEELMSETEFTLDASNFTFSESELRVKQGDTVTIILNNVEGFHDLVIDEFNVATEQIQAGNSDSITFVADQAGEFDYYCSVGNHRQMGMVGTLIVE